MARKLPLYCYREKTRHGKFIYVVRRERHGPRIRLPDDYGTKAWFEAYHAALSGVTTARPKGSRTSLAALIAEYQDAGEFMRLAPQTREQRAAIYRRMIEAAPDWDAANTRPEHIHDAMSRRTGNAANTFLKAVRGFFAWAVKTGKLPNDPTEAIRKINVKSTGYHSVTAQEVAAFRVYWGENSRQVVALDVAILTGARRGDLAILGMRHVAGDGIIEFDASKTGKRCYVPIVGRMPEIIEAARKDGRAAFIVKEDGTPYTVESLGNMFQRWFAEAGMPHCSVHGLRKHSATTLANLGVSAMVLMAIFGWTRVSQAEVYTREYDRRKLAIDGGKTLATSLTLAKGKGR